MHVREPSARTQTDENIRFCETSQMLCFLLSEGAKCCAGTSTRTPFKSRILPFNASNGNAGDAFGSESDDITVGRADVSV